MKCLVCSKESHYCVSCGFDSYAKLNLCNSKCAELLSCEIDDFLVYKGTEEQKMLWLRFLADAVYNQENLLNPELKKLVEKNKTAIGEIIVDALLEDKTYDIEPPLNTLKSMLSW